MKIRRTSCLVPVIPFSMALSLACFAADNEQIVPWHSVPVTVQDTVTANTKGLQIGDVEKETKEGGTIYEAKVVNDDGSRLIVKVAEDGKLIGFNKKSAEVEVPWTSLPSSAKKTITDHVMGKPVGVIEKETDNGKVIYEARVFQEDGSHLVIKVLQDGRLISTRTRQGYPGQKLAKDAKLSISDARAIALKAQPGQLTDEELEKEKGGSGLRYSFDVKAGDGVHEVGIDAVTGAVLENSVEGDNPD